MGKLCRLKIVKKKKKKSFPKIWNPIIIDFSYRHDLKCLQLLNFRLRPDSADYVRTLSVMLLFVSDSNSPPGG